MIYLGRKDNLVWTAQGTSLTPPDTFIDALGIPWCAFINGYFSTIRVIANFAQTALVGIWITSYDELGNICTYTTRGFFGTNQRLSDITNVVSTTIFQTGNKFKITCFLGTLNFTVPNVFVNNALLEFNPTTIAIPIGPCGVGTNTAIYFLNKYGVTVYEYIVSHPLASDFYASFYDQNNFLLGGGYYGSVPNGGPDPVYQVGLNLPPGNRYNGPYYKGDGQVITSNGTYAYQFQTVGATQLLIQGSPNLLVCGGSGFPAASIVSGNSWYTFLQGINAPAFAGTGNEATSGCTDSSSIYGLGMSYNVNIAGNVCGVCRIYSQDWLQDLSCNLFPGNYWAATRGLGISYSKSRVYTLYDLSGVGGNFRRFQMYSAPYVAPPLAAHVSTEYFGSLANYHRAVSPDGAFQA